MESPACPTAPRVLISGSSGLLGRTLAVHLHRDKVAVDRLVRRKVMKPGEIQWEPAEGRVNWPSNYRCDVVIHLAGVNVAEGRWTAARKARIRASRVQGTRTLMQGLGELAAPPPVVLSASAIGIYGDRGDEVCAEGTGSGEGFLAEVCQAWESEVKVCHFPDTRCVMLRTGIVLSPAGGALARMLPVFRMGLGGTIGSGQQWMSWISLPDWVRAVRWLMSDQTLHGPVNLVAPHPRRQRDFVQVLGAMLKRPAILPTPVAALRLALGSMVDDVLLASARVQPEKLLRAGYEFEHSSLEAALRSVLDVTVRS